MDKNLLKVAIGFDLAVVRDKNRKLVLSVYSQAVQRHFPKGTLKKVSQSHRGLCMA